MMLIAMIKTCICPRRFQDFELDTKIYGDF